MADNELQQTVEDCEQQVEKSTEDQSQEFASEADEASGGDANMTEMKDQDEKDETKSDNDANMTEMKDQDQKDETKSDNDANMTEIKDQDQKDEAKSDSDANMTEMKDQDQKDETKSDSVNDDEDDNEDDRKLFVGGLSWETQDKGLREYMSQYGEIASCIVKKDNSTGRSRGFGFVVFKEIAGLDKALEARPHTVDGREIDSKKAEPQRRESKLFVGGVKPETEDKVIMDYFSQFGKIVKIERPQDPKNKMPKGFCFVTFSKDGPVKEITKKRYHKLDEKEVECKFADPPHEGGGGGGRGRGRGRGGRGSFGPGGYPMFGGFPGNYGFPYGEGGFNGPAYGNFAGFTPGFGGYGGGMYGGGGYGYRGQQSGYGKSGRGGRHQNFKPY